MSRISHRPRRRWDLLPERLGRRSVTTSGPARLTFTRSPTALAGRPRSRAARAPDVQLTYAGPRGIGQLRRAVAVSRPRACRCRRGRQRRHLLQPRSRTEHAVARAPRAGCAPGGGRGIASWRWQTRTVEHAGLEAVPVPVDADGLVVAELERLEVDAVVLTPAHQYLDRSRSHARAAGRADRVGATSWRADRRRRLRRRVPLRPRAGRRLARPRAGRRRLLRHDQQDPRAGPSARLDGAAGASRGRRGESASS